MVCLKDGSSLEELNAPFLNGVIRSGIKFIPDRQMKISEATLVLKTELLKAFQHGSLYFTDIWRPKILRAA